MTREQLKTKLQTTTKNEFKLTNAEISEAFPCEHDWFPGQIVTRFDELTPWAANLGWVANSEKTIDQTLQTFPDTVFKRI